MKKNTLYFEASQNVLSKHCFSSTTYSKKHKKRRKRHQKTQKLKNSEVNMSPEIGYFKRPFAGYVASLTQNEIALMHALASFEMILSFLDSFLPQGKVG